MTLEGFASGDDLHAGQWRLSRIDVVNWGTFDGFHSIDIARQGHLFTGASGSGKSSLLDAIATVITPGRVTFNAAAQESTARAGDRSRLSYVRGAWSKEPDASEDRAVAAYLRPSAVWSGVLLRFEDLTNRPVNLVRLFHLRGSSRDDQDLKDLALITRDDRGLLDYKPYVENGIEKRRLDAEMKPVISSTIAGHKAYFARMRSLLGISSDSALQLLHRTQGAKNFGTLDVLFRSFMLDFPQTFARADAAVDQFAELDEAHRHVVDLRHQADALRAVVRAAEAYERASDDRDRIGRMQDSIEPHVRGISATLARDALAAQGSVIARAEVEEDSAVRRAEEAGVSHEIALERVNAKGGGDAAHLRQRVADAVHRSGEIVENRARFDKQLASVHIAAPDTRDEFDELIERARADLALPPPAATDYELHDRHSVARELVEKLDREIRNLQQNPSNIGADLRKVRRAVAERLGIDEGQLPFAGELIEVRDDEAAWQGAIERVLAPVSSAMLVRADILAEVRRTINAWHLNLDLTIDVVPFESERPPATRDPRSIVHKLDVREGPFAPYLSRRIAEEFNYACVGHPDELGEVDRGVTIEGLLKRSSRRYVKSDRHRVDDRTRWVLGWDNSHKLDEYRARYEVAMAECRAAESAVNTAVGERDAAVRRRSVLESISALPWSAIDVIEAERDVVTRQRQLDEFAAPGSDLAQAMELESQARKELGRLREEANAASVRAVSARAERDRIQVRIDDLLSVVATEVPADVAAELDERFRAVRRNLTLDSVNEVALTVQGTLTREQNTTENRMQDAVGDFSSNTGHFREKWKAVAADLTGQIGDRAGYRLLLEGIVTRGLPEHEQNFRKLLRERSRDSMVYLRDELGGALRRVEERIDPVNASLGRSQFDRGRFLRIKPKLRRSGEVTDFLADLATIVDGNWADETLESAETRFSVVARVMSQLDSKNSESQAWRKRVLDTREHVTFLAQEVDAQGLVVAVHESSAGLSGGQRQKLVVFCLAAALRYQLASPDEPAARYGTIVLDEAFDKADAQYTRMAMDVFVEFGFHMILATPQKLLQTLEPYIGAVTSVANPTRRASLMSNVEIERADDA